MGIVQNGTITQTKMDPILWVGSVSQIRLPHFFPFQKQEVEIILSASLTEALSLLRSHRFSCVLVQDMPVPEALEFLYQARFSQPMAPRLLIAEDLLDQEIREGINKAQIFRFIRWPLSQREVWSHLEQALQVHAVYLARSSLLKESSSQNKQLEALTHSLEAMVEERTQYIELSHREEREKLNRERQLIRFIKDLASQNSFEDILGILRKDLRKFHKMGDPLLVYRLQPHKVFFMNFEIGHFSTSESATVFEMTQSSQVAPAHLVRHLANHFGRPFAKTYVVPLELRLTNQFIGGQGEAMLCLENSLSDKELTPFVDYMNDRMGPLSMALDRVLLESQLSRFSYRWEKTFDGMRDPVAIVDVDFNVIRANRKFSDKFLFHKCHLNFAGHQEPCEGCPVVDVLREGVAKTGQVEVRGRVYQVHSYPVLNGEGDHSQTTNVVNQYVDITQSRELYLRMLQSEKMGAIGMLAGHIAHELNNPLTGLRSLSQVLLQEVPPGTNLHSDLEEIEKATARSQKIIKNLLDFSRGEDQPSESIGVDEIIEKTLPMLKSALRFHRMEVHLHSLGNQVFVEPHLLQQVVFNIINNACQAMKDPGRITVTTEVQDNEVFIHIEDTGPGIPLEIQRRIFEPFFTTKKEGHGTGLGLSMSKSIVEKFGGRIEYKSMNPQGSCFSIVLPKVQTES